MQIRLKNQIQFDQEMELVEQLFPVSYQFKKKFHYLVFENEDKEKVVLKFDENQLVMTRYSQPKSVMRFIKDNQAPTSLSTPVGYQRLLTETSYYDVDLQMQTIELFYRLMSPDNNQEMARYQMTISWK